MKTLYLECNMGAAGDMLMAALLELHDAPKDFLRRLNSIGIPGAVVTAQPSEKCGIKGTHIHVSIHGQEEEAGQHSHAGTDVESHVHAGTDTEHHNHAGADAEHPHRHHHHSHQSYHSIAHLMEHLPIPDSVKKNALAVYQLIAEAESHVHGRPVDQIHFHEVGEMDAVTDIIGVCMLMDELHVGQTLASPINTGSGFVRCAHGVLPVPAPAAAYILRDIPMYSDNIQGELCTPTGAALLKHFAGKFCRMPVMAVSNIGYGMGKKEFERANCVRAFLGTTEEKQEEVVELVCNLDDMTPETAAFAQQLLMEEGALDVYTVPIGMKKGRQGISLTCMCRPADKDKMLRLLFLHTTSLGIREYRSERHVLQREVYLKETKYGTVRLKRSSGFGVEKTKPEYEDLARIARENQVSIQEILHEIAGE